MNDLRIITNLPSTSSNRPAFRSLTPAAEYMLDGEVFNVFRQLPKILQSLVECFQACRRYCPNSDSSSCSASLRANSVCANVRCNEDTEDRMSLRFSPSTSSICVTAALVVFTALSASDTVAFKFSRVFLSSGLSSAAWHPDLSASRPPLRDCSHSVRRWLG